MRFGRIRAGFRKIKQSKTARRALGYGGAALAGYGAYRAVKRYNPNAARTLRRTALGAGAAFAAHSLLKKGSTRYANASKGYERTIRASARLARMRFKNPNALRAPSEPPPLPVGHRRVEHLNPHTASMVVNVNNRTQALAHQRQAKLARIQARRSMSPSQKRRMHIAAAVGVTAAAGALNYARKRIMTPRNIAIKKGYRTQTGKLKVPPIAKHGASSIFKGIMKYGKSRNRRRVRRYMA